MFWLGLWWMLSEEDPELESSKRALVTLSDEARLRFIAETIAPGLEARAGRRFLTLPRVRLLSRDDALTTLEAEHLAINPSLTEDELHALRREVYASLSLASAVYDTGLQEIVINRDAILRLSGGRGAAVVDGLVRCAIGHELTHALQDQHLGLEALTLPEDLRGLWVEGHAEWLSETSCPASAQRAGAANPSLYDPDVPEPLWPYVFGAHAARLTAEAHGVEAIWSALAGRSPDRAAMNALLTASRAPGWSDPSVLRPLLAPLERDHIDHMRERALLSPGQLSAFTPDEAPALADPMLSESTGVANYQITLMRGRASGEASAEEFVSSRCRVLDQGVKDRGDGLPLFLAFTMTGYWGPGARLARVEEALLERADGACAAKFNFNTGHYYELWVSRGQRLAGGVMFASEVWAADLKKLTRAVEGALDLSIDEEDPDVSQHPTMRALTPPAERAGLGWSTAYLERAALLILAGHAPADCAMSDAIAPRYHEFEDFGAEAQAFVYLCAVEAGNLTAAAAHLPPPDRAELVPVATLIQHIRRLRDGGRAKDALALAESRCPAYAPTERAFCLAAAR